MKFQNKCLLPVSSVPTLYRKFVNKILTILYIFVKMHKHLCNFVCKFNNTQFCDYFLFFLLLFALRLFCKNR